MSDDDNWCRSAIAEAAPRRRPRRGRVVPAWERGRLGMEMVGRDDVPRTRASLDAACLVRREVTTLD